MLLFLLLELGEAGLQVSDFGRGSPEPLPGFGTLLPPFVRFFSCSSCPSGLSFCLSSLFAAAFLSMASAMSLKMSASSVPSSSLADFCKCRALASKASASLANLAICSLTSFSTAVSSRPPEL